jgi:hypothetical protein
MIVDKANLPSNNAVFSFVADYQKQWGKLWGK